jgi:dTDP-4-dehydrorhamnose reductase
MKSRGVIMKAVITGMNGAVAPNVANYFREQGVEVVAFNRATIDINDYEAISRFLKVEKPDYFLHLATGPADWAEKSARICGEQDIRYLFTSTVSVFSEQGSGPYTIDSTPNAEDNYGRYKRDCEARVKAANPEVLIARLGWQIGSVVGSNNMFDYLERTMAEKGKIEASKTWYPSCSYMEDTAETLFNLVSSFPSDLYLVNSNQKSSFFEIVNGINKEVGNWKVVPGASPNRDDRMFDDRIHIVSIEEKLNLH